MNLYDNKKIDFTKETMFFGEGKNTQRFDVMKYPWFDQSNDKQQGLDWKHDEVAMTQDNIDFNTKMTVAEKFIYTRVLQKLIFLDSLQGRGPMLTFGQIATLPELENVILTWNYFEGCLTPDTEVLTSNGWKLIPEVTLDDKVLSCDENGIGSFENPSKLHIYKSNGYINKFEGKNISQYVTDQHRMLLENRKGKREVKRVQEIKITNNKSNYHLVNALSGTRTSVSKKEFSNLDKFLVALQADGTIQKEYINDNGDLTYKDRNGKRGFIRVTFNFSKERKIKRMRKILEKLSFEYNLIDTKRGEKQFSIKVPNNINLSKNFSDWINLEEVSYDWGRNFIFELTKWDGWDYGNPTIGFDTTNKNNAKFVEMIALIGGFKTSLNISDNPTHRKKGWKPFYRLTFNSKSNISTRTSIEIERVAYDGNVYCLSVPGGFFAIRHNGKTSITGNCKHSKTYTHNLRNVYDDPAKVFDESFEIEELMKLANEIAGPYNKLYNMIIDYIYYKNHEMEISEEMMYNLRKQIILALVNINILEGMRFYSGFACIWAMTEGQGYVPGTSKNLQLICRDENQHLALTQKWLGYLKNNKDEGFVEIYKEITPEIEKMYKDAYQQEMDWIDYLFSKGSYIGMNAEISKFYMSHITYKRMKAIGLEPITKDYVKNPLPWVDKYISTDKTEVLAQESEITNYVTGGINNNVNVDREKMKKLLF